MGKPVLPDYTGGCISNVVPALLEPADAPPIWLPDVAVGADQVVLLVLDGLGWEQLEERRDLAPVLTSMAGGPITSVAPSTTATALTSIATGLTPGEHGVVGYRVAVDSDVLNVLRWTTPAGDARKRIDPHELQPQPAFLAHRPPIVTKAEFVQSGFSGAHLSDVRFNGYRVPSTLVVELRRLLRAGEPFVYAYYDGIDKVSHEYGLGDHYDAELAAVDRLVGDIVVRAAARTRSWWSPRTTDRSRWAIGWSRSTPTSSARCRSSPERDGSAGSTPDRAGRRRSWRPSRPITPTPAGCARVSRPSRRGGGARRSPMRHASASATSRWSPRMPCPTSIRPTRARSSWSVGTAR